jgi:hypothetical protein
MVARRRRRRPQPDHIDGRPPEFAGKPGEHHMYASTPDLAQIRQAARITDEQASALLREQGYSIDTLRALEAGQAMSRLTVSRITACLGLSHARAKGEIE